MIDGIPSYPNMKDSGVPWLRDLPEHWETLPNRAIFTEIKERDHPDAEMLSVTITKGVLPQRLLLGDSSKKDSSNPDRSAYKLVRPGDIVYNKMRAWQGAVGMSHDRGIVSPAYVVQRPRDGAHPRYFHYLLRTPAFAREAERWSYGIASDMWSLRPEHFKMIYSCLPPLDEQAAIVRFLDYADLRIRRYIGAKQKLMKLLEEQKQTIIHRAVTRGLHPNVQLKPSGVEWLGDVPKHWDVARLRTRLVRNDAGAWGSDFSESGTIVLRSTEQAVDGEWRIESPARRALSPREIAATRLLEGDLVVTKSSGSAAHIGKTSLVSAEVERMQCGFSNFMQRLRCSAGTNPRFVKLFLNNPAGRSQLVYFSSTTTGLGNLSGRILGNLWLAFPPPGEQREVVEALDEESTRIDRLARTAMEQVNMAREYRTRLIADVVTGRLDVRGAAVRMSDEAYEAGLSDETEDLTANEDSAGDGFAAALEEVEL